MSAAADLVPLSLCLRFCVYVCVNRLDELWSILSLLDTEIRQDIDDNQSYMNHFFFVNMPELFLCETMHQLSLCISDNDERKNFVDTFQSRFQKQCIISSHVIGPILRDQVASSKTTETSRVVESFCTFGYLLPFISVPFEMRVSVAMACEDVVRKHFPESVGHDSYASGTREIVECLEFLLNICRLYRDRAHQPKHCRKSIIRCGMDTPPQVPHTLSLYFRRKALRESKIQSQ